ncbi:phage tail tube protein [Enterobacteriaceae bacterium H4N4]|uniref:Phage tail tube protein n=1 Tax=Silvania confinis TaxID=2926470 RepID=A0A9J6QDB2_9ENTR|nr:phage tail tube protein [Silvania confinis]MCU6668692.1 phage tail tube protein [Silvania confinis]
MSRIAGTCYFKIDGQQLSLTGGIEVPMNTKINDDVIGMAGDVDRKETHRAPYVKGTFKVPKDFPVNKVIGRLKGDDLTSYNLWVDYLDALWAVDVSNPAEILWPEQPAV